MPDSLRLLLSSPTLTHSRTRGQASRPAGGQARKRTEKAMASGSLPPHSSPVFSSTTPISWLAPRMLVNRQDSTTPDLGATSGAALRNNLRITDRLVGVMMVSGAAAAAAGVEVELVGDGGGNAGGGTQVSTAAM